MSNQPISHLCGLQKPYDWNKNGNFLNKDYASGDKIPRHWDWREFYSLNRIRDQKSCGSCWAFATIFPLETIIKMKTGRNIDLSEQWLISCNRNNWDCFGGWWAHDYHAGKKGLCEGTGAVLERNFRYKAENKDCDGPYPHKYLLKDLDNDGFCWNYISEKDLPSVKLIKKAIFDFGPICAGVYANIAFKHYTSGVFNNHENKTPNHAINIVGWNDDLGENGVWIIRNSWSEDWGENGYMKIEYGCCNVGSWACYIEDFKVIEITRFQDYFLFFKKQGFSLDFLFEIIGQNF